MSTTNEQDRELIGRISQTLALLAQRQQLMDEWERQSAAREGTTQPLRTPAPPRRRRAVVLTIAAGIAICISAVYTAHQAHKQQMATLNETLEQTAPFRSASTTDHIAALLAQENYAAALTAIDSQEQTLQQEQQHTTAATTTPLSEEDEYAQLLRQEQLYQLQWLRIEALIGLQRTDEARTLLYSFTNSEGEHQQQATTLLESLGN